jgi:hypothetical protein
MSICANRGWGKLFLVHQSSEKLEKKNPHYENELGEYYGRGKLKSRQLAGTKGNRKSTSSREKGGKTSASKRKQVDVSMKNRMESC